MIHVIIVFSFHLGPDLMDPKAKDSGGEKDRERDRERDRGERGSSKSSGSSTSSLPYPWTSQGERVREREWESQRKGFPSDIQSYARSQEEYNTTAMINAAGHR